MVPSLKATSDLTKGKRKKKKRWISVYKSEALFSVNWHTERHKVSKIILAFLISISSQSKICYQSTISDTPRITSWRPYGVYQSILIIGKKLNKTKRWLPHESGKEQSDLTSEVFWGWSHRRQRCPSSHVDVWPLKGYFPIQTKQTLRATLCFK